MPTMSEGESGLRCVGCMRPYIQPGESPSEQVTTGEAAEQVTAGEVAEQVTAVEGECECRWGRGLFDYFSFTSL